MIQTLIVAAESYLSLEGLLAQQHSGATTCDMILRFLTTVNQVRLRQRRGTAAALAAYQRRPYLAAPPFACKVF